jgi:hypothetical protein
MMFQRASRARCVQLSVLGRAAGQLWFCKTGHLSAREIVDRFVETAAVDCKAASADLSAPDAIFHTPDGTIHRGRGDITASTNGI